MTSENSIEGPKTERAISLWAEQLNLASTGIAARVELQQKNANVNIVLLTAATGFIVNFISQHGYDDFIKSEVCIIVPLAALVTNIFIWRHVDHDANVLDQARYIEYVIRPSLLRLAGEDTVRWEEFLQAGRLRRPMSRALSSSVGNEAVIMSGLMLPFLIISWSFLGDGAGVAASAHNTFHVLTYVGAGTSLISLYLLTVDLYQFATLVSMKAQRDFTLSAIDKSNHSTSAVPRKMSSTSPPIDKAKDAPETRKRKS